MAIGEIQVAEADRSCAGVGARVFRDGASDHTCREGWSIIGANNRDGDG